MKFTVKTGATQTTLKAGDKVSIGGKETTLIDIGGKVGYETSGVTAWGFNKADVVEGDVLVAKTGQIFFANRDLFDGMKLKLYCMSEPGVILIDVVSETDAVLYKNCEVIIQ